MAKKWKAYPWPERTDPQQQQHQQQEEEEEEIDVVGDSPGSCWGPSSPTAGATAPSPPPTSPHGTTLLYNGMYYYFVVLCSTIRWKCYIKIYISTCTPATQHLGIASTQ